MLAPEIRAGTLSELGYAGRDVDWWDYRTENGAEPYGVRYAARNSQISGRGTIQSTDHSEVGRPRRDTSPSSSYRCAAITHCNSLGATRIFGCAAGNYATALKAASYNANWMECEKIIGPTDEIARLRASEMTRMTRFS